MVIEARAHVPHDCSPALHVRNGRSRSLSAFQALSFYATPYKKARGKFSETLGNSTDFESPALPKAGLKQRKQPSVSQKSIFLRAYRLEFIRRMCLLESEDSFLPGMKG
jgi:hypothetical protein